MYWIFEHVLKNYLLDVCIVKTSNVVTVNLIKAELVFLHKIKNI